MQIFQKFIATIIITSLILSLSLGLFFSKPKDAKAFLGIEDTVHDIIVEIKEIWAGIKDFGLDGVARAIAKMALDRMRYNIIRWAQGGFRDDNQPLAITNWKYFFRDAINLGTARFIEEFDLTPLCLPFRVALGERLGLDRPYYYLPGYQEYAACTIEDIVGNAVDFWENPSIALWGFDTWTALTNPRNNYYGSALLALERRAELEQEEKLAASAEGAVGAGYQNEKECIEENEDGMCMETRTKNLGSTIAAGVEKSVQADMDFLITADEIGEVVNALISALLNKALYGLGLSGDRYYGVQRQHREDYSYHRAFVRQLTPKNRYEIKSDSLARVLDAIQQFHRSIMTCDVDTAVNIHMYRRTYADIVDEEIQVLHSRIESTDLKPDFEVLDAATLDPAITPVMGYSWVTLPWARYPKNCRDMLSNLGLGVGATCSSIDSGLPPVAGNAACECLFSHDNLLCPPPPYPHQPSWVWSDAVLAQKWDFYNTCTNEYNGVLNRCEDCLNSAAQLCEQLEDAGERDACIERVCSNFGGIPGIGGGVDFYNRCLIEEQKYDCYACLKENYIPAEHCFQLMDYVARATIKYPGTFRRSESTLGIDWLNRDSIGWIGMRDRGCEGSDAPAEAFTLVDQICRIFPDFVWDGVNICRTYCPITAQFTEEEYYDINDNQPNGADCGNAEIQIEGEPGTWQVGEGAIEIKSKCCRVFTWYRPEEYRICAGMGAPGPPAEPPIVTEEFCPDYVERNCPDSPWDDPDEVAGGGAVTNLSISYRNRAFIHEIITNRPIDYSEAAIISIRPGSTGANLYVTTNYCRAPDGCCWATDTGGAATPYLNGDDSDFDNFGYQYCPYINPTCLTVDNPVAGSDLTPEIMRSLRVPDPLLPGDWEIRGYCTTNPLDPNDLSSYMGPEEIICSWTDTDASENCAIPSHQPCNLSAYQNRTLWLVVQAPVGGMAICAPLL